MLARTLGRTLAELEASMTHREYVLWQAEYSREPWGETRADLRMGRTCEVVVNSNNPKARTRPKDYLFDFERKAAKTPAEMAEASKLWVIAMGGTVTQRGKE